MTKDRDLDRLDEAVASMACELCADVRFWSEVGVSLCYSDGLDGEGMSKPKNVLWIMADQLRWDYLSCYGHPHLHTPNIDALAARGVRFNRAYVNSPICVSSRMSYYTGRYCRSHGSTWNFRPLRVGEPTLGDHLKPLGVRPVLVGKTHMNADVEGMEWLGIDPHSAVGVNIAEGGFELFERDDGVHTSVLDTDPTYDAYLRAHGFEGENPWHDWANSAEGEDGKLLSGWFYRYNTRAARVPEEHSETAYMTKRAMAFMEGAGEAPWLCHLSYIKPHWPYIVPAPYHDMYPRETWLPVNRSEAEMSNPHPVFEAYTHSRVSRAFSQDKVREAVLGAYMGLIKQIDDHLGRLFAWMEQRDLLDSTMIVMSSDHGDYLGDHWLGEKDFFHDTAVRVPLIVADPHPEADASRGTVSEALVEAIDLAPTFLNYFGGVAKPDILEGRDLTPILHGTPHKWREFAISEYDYGLLPACAEVGVEPADAQLVMCVDAHWKYVYAKGFRPLLFDLESDPIELQDLGASAMPEHVAACGRAHEAIFEWALRHHSRVTPPIGRVKAAFGPGAPIIITGIWDEEHYAETFEQPFSGQL